MPNTITKKIKAINLGPGGGEYTYHPELVKEKSKFYNSLDGKESHFTKTLNRLETHYPSLEKIQIYMGWFGDSQNAGRITIQPKVESLNVAPHPWQVGEYDKENALLVSRTNKSPNWGGTPSDESIFKACEALQNKGYAVSLMPVLYLDMPGQPWRGDIKANSEIDVNHFFGEYNKMILHYANLTYEGKQLSTMLDSFIIGSELKALLAYQNQGGEFYAVEKMQDLIKQVYTVVGAGVKLSYAANWGEYHHINDGWHHLDPIWAMKEISFVGVNPYFPLTENLPPHAITYTAIYQAWASGEQYDYWLDGAIKKNLDDEWAAKNIEYWYRTRHVDPDGEITAWKPKMKPVVFTELGFSSVSGNTNQPYIFVDEKSNIWPMHSAKKSDVMAQAVAYNATIDFWHDMANKPGTSKLVGDNIFFYMLDIRCGFQNHPELYSDAHAHQFSHAIKIDEL